MHAQNAERSFGRVNGFVTDVIVIVTLILHSQIDVLDFGVDVVEGRKIK